ncbi:choline oxidase [Saccharopolyspora erythraea NRRL 2338]|uniref:Oxidoreductase n=2 Tax=Saccharopolyspora erythraea TaxID=1836 RepID=A4FHE6_SACEN|nr:GMC family oxidoreductase N-terminal domain-containing protein [Saccharopolyspora erythraea]EQD86863.1 choline oxidase [Saccharopolyspora erythraea D]PFG97167.1 choline oxidase [Saccharopolyspora erythraea NRRL 2338]QRK87369.1 GMC family oxidoreductase N-terminal domain-containing protein [Saccharopolyspora erythraea]CAM03471.1 putative oxidoreductase [Saccharopolyspora erythraea NRRL 2338]
MAVEASYDYVIIGGGTAGCVLAARLSADPDRTVCVVEGGPSDVGDERVLNLRNWINLLESDLDYGYTTVDQPRGNSHIVHSRARVLGGCSSHNTLISFKPFPQDWDDWGRVGWNAETMEPYWERLRNNIVPVAEKDRNPIASDFVAAASSALGVPVVEDFNARPFHDGAGFFSVAYDPETGRRSSASVAYLHPVLDDRPNLELLLETWAYRLLVRGGRAQGVEVRHADGSTATVMADREVLVCAGAVDSPRLLMLSGLGPADELRKLGIEVVADLPGVGENLLDHPESVIVWETDGPLPPNSVMDSDAGLFVRRDTSDPRPDLMFHFYQIPFTVNTERLGYPAVEHGVCMTPNVPRARSTGRLWLRSADPDEKPALDFGYFTDPDSHDELTIVEGLRIAREVAATEPLRSWLVREVAPGPQVTGGEELSEYGRHAAHTVYHPAGTCAMGPARAREAVVDPNLNVRGIEGLRVVDASVFPRLPTINPMVAVLMVAERAVDLITT